VTDEGVKEGSSSHVALLIKITSDFALSGCDHQVVSQIKFSALVQKGFFKVRLNDIGPWAAIGVRFFLLDFFFDFI